MALYSRKEFYTICGISKSHLNVYIARDKIILTDKKIDDALPENAYYKKKWVDELAIKKGETASPEPLQSLKSPSDKSAAPVSEANVKESDVGAGSKYDLEVQVKELDIVQRRENIEIARIKRAKMEGEVIPTDLVSLLFASHFKNVTTSFHQAVENLISTIAKQNDLDRKQVANIRGELTEVINKAIEAGIYSSKKAVGALVKEYSLKKERGQSA